jgi:erythromycin esterase-like protein
VGFYGLDVYSLYESVDEVVAYLDRVDRPAATRVRGLYACFSRYAPDAQAYGAATQQGTRCETQARDALAELTRRAQSRPTDPADAEALFSAVRNAQSVANAERYFRTAYLGGLSTWNIRDQEMANNLRAIEDHLRASTGREAKIVVWAHNTHTGDARVTASGEQGEHNIGQLARERHGANAVLVGFHTYTGTVLAASEWGEAGRVQNVRPALRDSYAGLFHATGTPSFLLCCAAAPHTRRR